MTVVNTNSLKLAPLKGLIGADRSEGWMIGFFPQKMFFWYVGYHGSKLAVFPTIFKVFVGQIYFYSVFLRFQSLLRCFHVFPRILQFLSGHVESVLSGRRPDKTDSTSPRRIAICVKTGQKRPWEPISPFKGANRSWSEWGVNDRIFSPNFRFFGMLAPTTQN